jgi:opacity protein-like surface antigen
MSFKPLFAAIGAASIAFTVCLPATAQGWYAGGAISWLDQDKSSNSGVTTSAFNTGNGAPVIPNGTTIASGTAYGWDTEFDTGLGASAEVGYRYGNGFRSGVELTYTKADVETHKGVNVAGTVIDGVDAAVLTGSATQLGATVGAVVDDGNGDIKSTGVFLNGYYDFNREGVIEPYIGAGIGLQKTEVRYTPSNVDIIDDSETKIAYQVKAGATYKLNEQFELFTEATYRTGEDIETKNNLFPGTLDIENKQTLVSLGGRYRFGG